MSRGEIAIRSRAERKRPGRRKLAPRPQFTAADDRGRVPQRFKGTILPFALADRLRRRRSVRVEHNRADPEGGPRPSVQDGPVAVAILRNVGRGIEWMRENSLSASAFEKRISCDGHHIRISNLPL